MVLTFSRAPPVPHHAPVVRRCCQATVTDEGLARVGWSTSAASLDLGTDSQGFGFGGTGKKSHAKKFDAYGEAFGLHDTVGW